MTTVVLVVGVSFVAIFIVSANLMFWVFGGAHSLSWDYLPGVPQDDDAETRLSWKQKPLGSLIARYILKLKSSQPVARVVDSAQLEKGKERAIEDPLPAILQAKAPINAFEPSLDLMRQPSHISQGSGPPAATTSAVPRETPPVPVLHNPANNTGIPSRIPSSNNLMHRIMQPVRAVFSPVTIALIIALPIALVNDLKALFIDVTEFGGPNLNGPDGKPPLAFVIDTGT